MILDAEELRFRAAIPASLIPVRAFERFMKSRGYETLICCMLEVNLQDNGERDVYADGEDLIARKGDGDWTRFEIKGRTFDFTCAADFPYQTMIVDRVNKVDEKPQVHWYVNVSKDLRFVACAEVKTKEHWTKRTIFDQTKGYGATNYECPKHLLRCFNIEVPEHAVLHYCRCGKWGAFGYEVRMLKGLLGTWYCAEHRP